MNEVYQKIRHKQRNKETLNYSEIGFLELFQRIVTTQCILLQHNKQEMDSDTCVKHISQELNRE